jgi:3-methyladenine DNA glycosylase AlkD
MSLDLTAKSFISKLEPLRTPEKAASHHHLTADEEDVILGVAMGQVFKLAKEFIGMPLDEVEKLLESPFHEARVGAVSIMDFQAREKKTTEEHRQALFDLYLRRHDRINYWDLVDRSAMWVVGRWLVDRPRDALYELARSADTWERRTAIVSTLYFTRVGESDDAFRIAELLLGDEEDFVHKATGWALREAGKLDRPRLERFLDDHAATMPRVTLRYAIEHFDKDDRDRFLQMKKSS